VVGGAEARRHLLLVGLAHPLDLRGLTPSGFELVDHSADFALLLREFVSLGRSEFPRTHLVVQGLRAALELRDPARGSFVLLPLGRRVRSRDEHCCNENAIVEYLISPIFVAFVRGRAPC